MKKVLAIIGARPQFIKHFALDFYSRGEIDLITIHTGQHYDENMSQVFFNELKMSKPDFVLSTGGGNHGEQTGKMMIEIEKIMLEVNPDIVVVYGDTNSTLAGALVASKLHIPIAHIEAGVRSYNKKLPEEVNRLLTDHITSLFFVPNEKAIADLAKEGINKNVYNVGDIMKDVLDYITENEFLPNSIKDKDYYYATIHRPYNTDYKEKLSELLDTMNSVDKKVIFAVHPRTLSRMESFGLSKENYPNIDFIEPQSYINNIMYIKNSQAVITDSGGIQKEAYWLKVKCITLRSETEWVETLNNNWNELVHSDVKNDLPRALKNTPGNYQELYSIKNTTINMINVIKTFTDEE